MTRERALDWLIGIAVAIAYSLLIPTNQWGWVDWLTIFALGMLIKMIRITW